MKAQKNPKAIFRVTLSGGDTCDHTYELPGKSTESKALIRRLMEMVHNAITGKQGCCYLFTNPLIYYNPDFVVSVRLTYVDCEECETLVADITREVCKPPKSRTAK